ncbi:unnamed protein product, partial [marine sediment metagenome]
SIFPSDTNLTCTFKAHANAHTWSTWAEIVDSATTKLSDAFATEPGHITSIIIETVSDNTALYMYEIAWGVAKNPGKAHKIPCVKSPTMGISR